MPLLLYQKLKEYILVYTMLLTRVAQKFQEYKLPYAIVGGHAVALHGAVRGTLDIDFIIKWSLKNLKLAEQALEELGLKSRLPLKHDDLFHFKEEYMKNRNLLAWNFFNPNSPSEQIDLVITHDLSGKKTKKMQIQGIEVKILELKELIAMKRESGREQDLADIKALEKLSEK